VRTLTPFLAGTHAMPRGRFTLHNVVGGVLWGAGLVVAGYFLGKVPFVSRHMDQLVALLVGATVVFLAALVAVRVVRRRRRVRPV
jgi:membrane-associated protein